MKARQHVVLFFTTCLLSTHCLDAPTNNSEQEKASTPVHQSHLRADLVSVSLLDQTNPLCWGQALNIRWQVPVSLDFSIYVKTSGPLVAGEMTSQHIAVSEPHAPFGTVAIVLSDRVPTESPFSVRACLYTLYDGLLRGCSGNVSVRGYLDACGICSGDNSRCAGCDRVPNSGLAFDACRVCGGDNRTCRGCDGELWSSKRLDTCGVCGGNNSTCLGCDGVPGSSRVRDMCGVCGGNNSSCLGCDWVTRSGKVFDLCNVCGGNNSTCAGCDGVLWSAKRLDACRVCGGDNQSCMGCDGVPWSGKILDSCRNCGGNDTSCATLYSLKLQQPPLCMGATAILSWTAPSNRTGSHLICLFKAGNRLPHECVGVGTGSRGVSVWGASSALSLLAAGKGASVAWAWSDNCDDSDLVEWTDQRCHLLTSSGPIVLGAPADACGVCGGDNSTCRGCDGLVKSGARLDACGTCGGRDDSCIDPFLIFVQPAVCGSGPHRNVTLTVEWSGPSNHSVYDRLGLFRSQQSGLGGLLGGRCFPASGLLACQSAADCPAPMICRRLEPVPAATSRGLAVLSFFIPSDAALPLPLFIRYQRDVSFLVTL